MDVEQRLEEGCFRWLEGFHGGRDDPGRTVFGQSFVQVLQSLYECLNVMNVNCVSGQNTCFKISAVRTSLMLVLSQFAVRNSIVVLGYRTPTILSNRLCYSIQPVKTIPKIGKLLRFSLSATVAMPRTSGRWRHGVGRTFLDTLRDSEHREMRRRLLHDANCLLVLLIHR